MRKLGAAGWVFLAAALAPGGARAGSAGPGGADALIGDVPHVRQKPDFCGEACAEMFLRKLGHGIGQDQVFNSAGVDPLEGRGCRTAELNAALKSIGFKTGEVWTRISPDGVDGPWRALHADLAAGVPSIVCMRYLDRPDASEHFRLVLGYDAKSDEVIYHEPAEDRGAYRRMKREAFLALWPLGRGEKTWTVIRLRLEAGKIAKIPAAESFTAADYAQHVRKLRQQLPGKDFTVVVEPPFVVAGDEDPRMVRERARSTVNWAAKLLKQDYFRKDPPEIITVWLFKDKDSYERNAKALFGGAPTTPYGYYSQQHAALVMNIRTGGGTLVHEMVHPFVRADFPDCPAWLNEGLGSLYEQCGEKNGRIYGYPNWRLPGLQKAIRAGTVPAFKELAATTSDEFYGKDKGTNYAQARYLCYYLQEQGLLVEFYRKFRDRCKADPTGYETLKQVLGEKDDKGMEAFRKKWEELVLGLRFP